LKILLSTFWKHPVTGGSSTFIEQLKLGLEREGHEVDILAHHPNLNGYYLVNSGKFIELTKLNMLVHRSYNHRFPKIDPIYKNTEIAHHCFELAASYFNLENYDLIHTQDIYSTRLLSRVKPKKTPLVASIHGCLATEYLIQKGNSLLNKQFLNKDFGSRYAIWQETVGSTSSDITIVATHWLKNLLMNEFNVEYKQLMVVPYALDITEFKKQLDEQPPVITPPGKIIIVCLARLAFIKGHKTLLGALAKLRQQRTDWVCWLVGDGNSRNDLKNMTIRLNLEQNVKFLGVQKSIHAILKQADICVLSSLQESLPYSIMEAQLAGKPVVVTDAGGLPEMVIHGETGLISQKGNSEALYNNIRELLENEYLRKTMGSNTQIWAKENWDLKKMISKTLAIYEQAIKIKEGGVVE
jgi:glycosyltransferase involved in cell wall biosynthesis